MTSGRTPVLAAQLVDHQLFTFLMDLEICKATRLQYCFSVLCFTPDSDPAAGGLSPTLMRRVTDVLLRELRAVDVVTSVVPSCVAVMLLDAEIKHVPSIAGRLTSAFEIVSGPGRNGRVGLTMSGGAGCYPKTAQNGGDLMDQAMRLMKSAKRDGGNRVYIPS